MRKLSAILALCCLLFLNAGYYFLYKCRLAEIKESVRKEILSSRKHELTKLTFSTEEIDQLDWEEKDEFRYKGEMYDVVSMEKKGDKVIIFCLTDKKEKALKQAFAETHRQAPDKNTSGSIFKFLKAPFLPTAFLVPPLTSSAAANIHSGFLFTIPSFAQLVLTPPPRAC